MNRHTQLDYFWNKYEELRDAFDALHRQDREGILRSLKSEVEEKNDLL